MNEVRQSAKERVRRAGIYEIKEGDTPVEIIVDSIKAISDGVNKLFAGRLTDKAVVLLISWASNVNQSEVRKVLDAMRSLEQIFLKRKPS